MKTKHKHKSGASHSAFTLIELLVVITIIAILASIAAPVFNNVQLRAQQTKALSNAKQIGLACKLYAFDHDGAFPADGATVGTVGTTSSEIFEAQLVQGGYIPNEAIFYVAGDHSATNVKLALANNNALVDTENGWGYTRDLGSNDDPRAALVYTQPATATTFVERGNIKEAGGVWDGRVIVVNVDYSGTAENVPSGGIINRDYGDGDVNILAYGGTPLLAR